MRDTTIKLIQIERDKEYLIGYFGIVACYGLWVVFLSQYLYTFYLLLFFKEKLSRIIQHFFNFPIIIPTIN